MFGDAVLAGRIAEAMLEQGVYVIAFSYPVVPPRHRADPGPAVRGAHPRPTSRPCIEAFRASREQVSAG